MQLQSHRRSAIDRVKVLMVTKKTALEQLSFIDIHFLHLQVSVERDAPFNHESVLEGPPPSLLGLVCLVGGEEGHAMGPEVSVEVRGFVKTPAAHLTAHVPVRVLALRQR